MYSTGPENQPVRLGDTVHLHLFARPIPYVKDDFGKGAHHTEQNLWFRMGFDTFQTSWENERIYILTYKKLVQRAWWTEAE